MESKSIQKQESKVKGVEAQKYAHSATLFQFCKKALAIKYSGNVKVIDQDVGAILGYDPADCSHWKKGKKNIKALPTIKAIADHLSVDEKLIIDITSGKVGLEEALFEYEGYGDFNLNQDYVDSMKKEYFRNPQRWGHRSGASNSFEEMFDIKREKIDSTLKEVSKKGNIKEAPVYLPELISFYPDIALEPVENLNSHTAVQKKGNKYTIQYRSPEMKPYLRFLIAKEFARIYLYKDKLTASGWGQLTKIEDIQANIFASNVLIPDNLLQNEVEKLDISMDIVTQLAELFWVSKGLVNNRLKDYLLKK